MLHTKSGDTKRLEGRLRGSIAKAVLSGALACVFSVPAALAQVPPKPAGPDDKATGEGKTQADQAAPKPTVIVPRPLVRTNVVIAPPTPAGPPPPPPAGKTPPAVTPPPAPVQPFPIEVDVPSRTEPRMALAGFQGGIFLRDPSDDIRMYVRGRLHLDFHSFLGGGASALPAKDGGALLAPRFFARRARIELAADLFRRWFALVGVDFGGQPITNPMGEAQPPTVPPGQAPLSAWTRFAPPQSVGATAQLANVYIDYTLLRQFHVMLGQHQAPFSMENRTGNDQHPWMERVLPIRAFVQPNGKEIGMTIWGDLNEAQTLSYELGVFVGDGPNRPQVDGYPDFIGRFVVRPFSRERPTTKEEFAEQYNNLPRRLLSRAHIGVSVQRGARDPAFVAYDYPAITTAQGFALWDPRYRDTRGRLVRVLPSGAQNRIGGELRLPFGPFDIRAEAYWVDNGTREAIDGLAFEHTERLGNVEGVGWYAHVSAWPVGDAFVNGEPGFSRPPRLDLSSPAIQKRDDDRRGLEVMAIAAGVHARYDGAARGGDYDAATPGAPGRTSKISVFQFGLGATYWHTRFVRVTVNWLAYHTPGSGAGENLALVPGNLLADADNPAQSATWMHEIGARAAVNF
ncbi:porin [Polyangium sp. y55x31]|uniref:porin n=1 Tax=Polyangium sp. y55x31 TaxID=3042688 RepID=UPI002482A490|nr:porin [Polyangium sp. y55x31]MDI1482580.1 porin [Polyangium sp. y55x31]